MSRSSYILLLVCVVFLGLHIWGAIQPSHLNWGTHLFAFYNPWVGIGALLLVVLLSIPILQSRALGQFESILRLFGRLPLIVNFVIAAGVLMVSVYLFPAKLHLLGDGAILLRSVPLGIGSDEISQTFRNQPLMFWIYRLAMKLHPEDVSPDPHTVYFSIDVIASLILLAILFWAVRYLVRPPIEKFLLGFLIFLGAGSQFFFGYVENYVLQYVATIAYALTGWLALERRVSVIIPIFCFVLMALLHLGEMVFAPSLALLIYLRWNKKKYQAIMLLAGIGVAGMAVLYIIGFNIIDFTRHVGSGSVDFLQLFTAVGGNFPYPMFSTIHLLDWLNASLLIAPFGLFLTVILILTGTSERTWKMPSCIFLIATALCGIFFTWVINSALGLARDWDLFSGFFVPLIILSVYLLNQTEMLTPRRYMIFLIVLLSFIHWAAWIGVNASAHRHLARMKTLNNPKLLSLTTQLNYNEALANLYFDTHRYADARVYYEQFLQIDSTNPRIIGNIADVYRMLGERDKYFHMLIRAETLGSRDPGVYSNLGVEYAVRKDTLNAISYNEKAVKLNPSFQKAYANLGILHSGRRNFQLADKYFTMAINLGMRDPLLFRYAGDVCVFLGDYRRSLKNYDTYLSATPGDRDARIIRDKVYKALIQQNHK